MLPRILAEAPGLGVAVTDVVLGSTPLTPAAPRPTLGRTILPLRAPLSGGSIVIVLISELSSRKPCFAAASALGSGDVAYLSSCLTPAASIEENCGKTTPRE